MTKEQQRLFSAIEGHVTSCGGNADSFHAGVRWAFDEVIKQIDMMAIAGYRFPILHIADFIDKTLGRKV